MSHGMKAVVCAVSIAAAGSALAQSGGEHGGESSGCGDLFGDLVHVLRDRTTGQPILELREIGYPQDVRGWGFCPIAVNAAGEPLSFFEGNGADELPTCDPADPTAMVDVDYFGRLSAGRTKERNVRMHFDEVISTIKAAKTVERDQVGRLRVELCDALGANCGWKIIDSPQENLALYQRVMKYGHIQTYRYEVDATAAGDPAAPTQYHPALDPDAADGLDTDDWPKFQGAARDLLPGAGLAGGCYPDAEPGDPPSTDPCPPERLSANDFVLAAGFLGGAADKTGMITVDLVQYLNRIVRITKDTEFAAANAYTLPALVRISAAAAAQLPFAADSVVSADAFAFASLLPAAANAQALADQRTRLAEKFVDFGAVSYGRTSWFSFTVPALVPSNATNAAFVFRDVALLPYLELRNPGDSTGTGIDGFAKAANDSVRAVEFVHNYAVPADLGLTLKPLR